MKSRWKFLGLLLPVVACTPTPESPASVAEASRAGHTLMAGCGMMVNGQMVYKKLRPGEECMSMSKPGAPMPNGVTMHYDTKP